MGTRCRPSALPQDWAEDPYSSLHLLPRGMDKHGLAGPRSLTWRSRHASLALTMYDLVGARVWTHRAALAGGQLLPLVLATPE